MRLEYSTDYSAPTDVHAWENTDEVLVRPVSPGSALVRLAQVSGGLQRHPEIATLLPTQAQDNLRKHRQVLLEAIEAGQPTGITTALRDAQNELRGLYISLCQPLLEGETGRDEADLRVAQLQKLGFGDPRVTDVQAVDISTVIATFSVIRSQVVTTLHFQDVQNATSYWLHEVRYFEGDERIEDPVVEASSPLFTRVRLALGERHLRIKSRNAHMSAISDEFTIIVPDLI